MMIHEGSCRCNQWQVKIEIAKPLEALNPRVCDCDYCQENPSAIISDPGMAIQFIGGKATIKTNGDQLASFHYCAGCGQFLAVGCTLNGVSRGAVNYELLTDTHTIGEPVHIQPRLLSAREKIERWETLWGLLHGLY